VGRRREADCENDMKGERRGEPPHDEPEDRRGHGWGSFLE
jgi:hypothetical protein